MTFRCLGRRFGDQLFAGALALGISAELVHAADDTAIPALLYALLSTLPLALRRKSPLVAFVLVMIGIALLGLAQPGFEDDSLCLVLAFFAALYSLGRHARGLEAWFGALGVVASMVQFNLTDGGLTRADLGDVAFALGFCGAPWAAGLTLRLRREREAELTVANEQLLAEQEHRARRAVAEERARIARELHDVVSHAISVTVLQARGARRTLTSDPDSARLALDAIEETNRAALGDMRRLLTVLRETEPDDVRDAYDERTPQPSLEHLDRLVDQVRSSGVPVTVEVRGDERTAPPGVDLSAFRIVQEGLTNVLKHAARAEARVLLEYGDDALTVTVTDNGLPGPLPVTEPGCGHGLIGIQERVAVAGGEMTAGPKPGGGFEIRARLPFSVEVS